MNEISLGKQSFAFYMQRAFGEISFLGPIIGLFYLSSGLDYFQIMVMQVIFSLVFAVSQVPTGIVADKFGRKASLIAGAVLLSVSMFLLVLPVLNFWVFVVSEVIFGVGLAFRSGADTALMYSFLEKNNKSDGYTSIEGHANFILGISSAICSVTAGYMFSINSVYPIVASAIWPLFGIMPILMLRECKEHKTHNKSKKLSSIFKAGLKNVVSSPRLKTILLYSVLFIAVLHITFWFYPPSLIAFNVDAVYFGWIFMVLNIFYSISARFATKFVSKTKGYSLTALFMTLSIGILLCGIIGKNGSILFVLFFLPDQLARGWYPVVYNKFINKYIKDDIRATVLSFMSTVQQVAASCVKLLFGFLLTRYEIFNVRIVTGVIMVSIGVVLYLYMKRNLQEKIRGEDALEMEIESID